MRSISSDARTGSQETSKILVAIGAHESNDRLRLVTFHSDNLPESRIIGYVEGDMLSVTVFHHSRVFVIGGHRMNLWRQVSTFDVFTGSRDRVSDLRIARKGGHSAITSRDEIFVCGGHSVASKSCEAFNPRSNTWRRLPDMGQGREGFPLVFLTDTRLLAIGGQDVDVILSSCEMIEIRFPLAAWRPVASMREPRNGHVAVRFDDRVFVAGGIELTSSEIFTPPPFGSTTEIGQWTCIRPRTTRVYRWSRSLVVISEYELIIFSAIRGDNGIEGAVERFARDSIPVSELLIGDEFDAWTWTPLPRISNLKYGYMIGVHCLY